VNRAVAWPLALAACILAAGGASLALGQDANWDLRNYHFHNPWALLNGRWRIDLAPAQVQSFYNPLGDLPFYFLASTLTPRGVALAMAIPAGLSAFFLAKIAALLFAAPEGARRWVAIASAVAIGVTGAAAISLLSSTMNDWNSTVFVIASLYVALRGESPGWAGFLMGCAAGLKLAYAPYAVGLVVALMTYGTPRERLRRALRAGAFAFLGWLTLGGAWSAFLWSEYGNPFFPYFNGIFRSEQWLPQSYDDTRLGPRNLLQWLAFPLYFSRGAFYLVADASFRDYRLAATWVIGLVALVWVCVERKRAAALPAAWRVIIVMTLVSYLAWLLLMRHYRYALPLEMLSGLLIAGAVHFAFRERPTSGMVLLVLLAALLVVSTRKMPLGRVEFGTRFVDVTLPAVEAGALIVMPGNHAMSYTAPFFPADARLVSLENNYLRIGQQSGLARRAESMIQSHQGPLYLLEAVGAWPESATVLRYFGLARGACEPLRSNITYDDDDLHLCKLLRPEGQR
jgi:hypothetical protein